MKRLQLIILLGLFICFQQTLRSQVFGYPGATWVFKASPFLGFCSMGYESWEYSGDTVIFGENSKKINIVYKYAAAWDTTLYFNPSYEIRFFKVSGDTVRIFNSADTTWQEIYNFSLQIGDSTMSPLNNILNGAGLYCADSIPYGCPAVVVDTGHLNISGQSLRFYTVQYLNISGAMDTNYAFQTYYERIITLNYWYPNDWYSCHSTDACATPGFVCYQDNNMITDSLCFDVGWVETINIEETQVFDFTIYPNPASEILIVDNPSNQSEKYSVMGADGKLILSNIQSPINTSHLPTGVYFITNETRTWFKKWIKE